jgi:hypothetical protein
MDALDALGSTQRTPSTIGHSAACSPRSLAVAEAGDDDRNAAVLTDLFAVAGNWLSI